MSELAADLVINTGEIASFAVRVTHFLTEAGVDGRAQHRAILALDEILTNIMSHGGAQMGRAWIHIVVALDCVTTEIIDTGKIFDPRYVPEPDLSADLGNRAIGGLGLFLVRSLTDGIDYRHMDGTNQTTFWVKRELSNGHS